MLVCLDGAWISVSMQLTQFKHSYAGTEQAIEAQSPESMTVSDMSPDSNSVLKKIVKF